MVFDANDALRESLASHGLPVRVQDDGWIEVGESRSAVRARSYETDRSDAGAIARLDVSVALEDGRLLVESTGAPGPDADAAAVACMGKFLVGTLHPLLGAFFGHREHQDIERWSVRGVEFDAFLGPILAQSAEASPPAVPPIAPALKELVCVRGDVARRAHWIRLYFARMGKADQAGTFEAIWDNEPWPEMVEAMKKLEWPASEGFFSLRQFLVIAPVGAPEASRRDYRTLERSTRLMADACYKDRGLNDDAVFERLVAGGVDPALAQDTVDFAPLGFTAILFHGLKLSPDYQVMDASNTAVATKPLAGEPVYVAAREVAADLSADPETRERFMAVASRCSRFSAANQALASGKKVEEIELEPPMLFRDYRPRDGSAPAAGSGEAPKRVAPKPWWRIW